MEPSLLIDVSRVLDRSSLGRLPTGVDRVCLEYVRRLGRRSQAVLRWRSWRRILPAAASQEVFEMLTRPGQISRGQASRIVARACLPRWPQDDGKGRLYLNHGHSGLEDPELGPWLRRSHQRPVYMVHDLIPLTHPEYCRPGEAGRHAARMHALLTGATGVLANSEHTAEALRRHAARAGLAVPPLAVAPLAAARLPPPEATAPLPAPYFVVLGTIEPRKNHLLLLQMWRDLVQRLGSGAPHLVVIGQRGWECENVVDLLERCEALNGVVHELPACTDAQLSTWLGHARALLFPSFAEGYGLPLVEALMLRTPVLASDLPSFREIAGGVPEYLDPLDGPSWRQAVMDYADGASPRRQAQLLRMEAFRCPTWDQHFSIVEDFLERIA